jgi:hypothetical protein
MKTPTELLDEAVEAMKAGDTELAQLKMIGAWLAAGVPYEGLLDRERVQELAEQDIDDDAIVYMFSRAA